MAILGTIPVSTAPRPLYNPRAVSRLTISFPVVRKPRFGAYKFILSVKSTIVLYRVTFDVLVQDVDVGANVLLARELFSTVAFAL
jgi:hypothetical protein